MAGDLGTALDKRVEWLGKRAPAFLRIPVSRWTKLINSDDARRILNKFFAEKHQMNLFITFQGKLDELTFSLDHMPSHKKGMVVMKRKQTEVTLDNVEEVLFYEEMSKDPLEYTSRVLQEIYMPMVKNMKNHRDWPKVVSQDVIQQFQSFSSNVSLFVSQTKGTTVLPVPDLQEVNIETASEDRTLIHSLETTIINWTREIKKAIDYSPEKAFQAAEDNGQFPGPSFELDFWETKTSNLRVLLQQLKDQKLLKVINILERTGSTYVVAFQKSLGELEQAMIETREINRYLRPLRTYVDQMSSATFEELPSTFRPVLHVLSLIWRHCPLYGTVNMIVLLRQICNNIISQVYAEVDIASLWTEEIDKACARLRAAIRTCNTFRTQFFKCQQRVNRLCPERPWHIDKTNVLSRFDTFRERMLDLLDMAHCFEDFAHLERIEIGGAQGEMYSKMVRDVHSEFLSLQQQVQTSNYDALDLSSQQFGVDYRHFRNSVADFDKRLCFVIAKGFQDSPSASSAFKLLESFETQMRRNPIREEVEACYGKLLQMFDRDLTAVYQMFHMHQHDPPSLSGLPKMSGTLTWCRAMLSRIMWPMEKFQRLIHDLRIDPGVPANDENDSIQEIRLSFSSEREIEQVMAKYESLSRAIQDFEKSVYNEWVTEIDTQSQEKLDDFLLKRLPDNGLAVNFDTVLSSCMQEVKYLKNFNIGVPFSANSVFEKRDRFRKNIMDLERIVRQYNTIIRTVLDVERPLIEERKAHIDQILSAALSQLNWNDPEKIDTFVLEASKSVSDLYNRLNFLKGNVKTIEKMISSWMKLNEVITAKEEDKKKVSKKPSRLVTLVTFWRRPGTVASTSSTEEDAPEHDDTSDSNLATSTSLTNRIFEQWKSRTSVTISKPEDVISHGANIHRIVETSRETIEADKNSQAWKNYVSFLNDLVEKGLLEASRHCMQYLVETFSKVDSVDMLGEASTAGFNILLDARLELYNGKALFSPTIDMYDGDDESTLQSTVNCWIERVFNISASIPRLDDPSLSFLSGKLQSDKELQTRKQKLLELLGRTVSRMEELRKRYLEYRVLWEEDPAEILQQFVSSHPSEYPPGEEFEEDDDMDDEKLGDQIPLDEFKSQIEEYERNYNDIQSFPELACFGWISINTQPIRTAVSSLAADRKSVV